MAELKQRKHFEHRLHRLHQEVMELGMMVDTAVRKSLMALRYRDAITAVKICEEDQQINAKRFDIEKEGLILIATQQPMASDLRFLAAVLEIITELERMGDYAKGIARITMQLDHQENLPIPIEELEEMASLGLDMFRRALLAFQERNTAEARKIPAEDDRVDQLYNQVFQGLIEQTQLGFSNLYQVNHILWVAHNLERLADRATNICERVIFWVDGDMQELDAIGCGSDRPFRL